MSAVYSLFSHKVWRLLYFRRWKEAAFVCEYDTQIICCRTATGDAFATDATLVISIVLWLYRQNIAHRIVGKCAKFIGKLGQKLTKYAPKLRTPYRRANYFCQDFFSVKITYWHRRCLCRSSLSLEDCFYTVSQKNIPDVFSYNSRKHCRIFIIFGRNITEKVSKQKML